MLAAAEPQRHEDTKKYESSQKFIDFQRIIFSLKKFKQLQQKKLCDKTSFSHSIIFSFSHLVFTLQIVINDD
jgi:hypothetical protein